jgi:hypothetical protein
MDNRKLSPNTGNKKFQITCFAAATQENSPGSPDSAYFPHPQLTHY